MVERKKKIVRKKSRKWCEYMTWSYTKNPSSSSKDMVRFKIGDTICSDQLLSDEEIMSILEEQSNPILASVICAQSLGGRYSRLADTTVGKTRISYSQKAKSYLELADKLEIQYKKSYKAVPYCGGISISDKEIDENNPDLVKPKFRMDMMDNPGTIDTSDDLFGEYYGL